MKENLLYSCPAWEDLPDIYLYMDQAISILEKYLSPFSEEKSITSTMINNYVKQKIISPPQNKKYSREQIANIYMLCILKRFMQLSDAAILIAELEKSREISEAFGIFKMEFDSAMRYVFSGDEPKKDKAGDDAVKVLRGALMAFAAIARSREEFLQANEKWQKSSENALKEMKDKKKK